MIFHLLYISERTDAFNEEQDLKDILDKSRINNKRKEVTGILIKNGLFFIQVLEGKQKDVMSTYDVILADKRHSKARVLMTYNDHTRIFPKWDMGLVQGESDIRMNELIPLLHQDVLKLENSKEKVISILKKFNQSL